jgi:hypothetical protein
MKPQHKLLGIQPTIEKLFNLADSLLEGQVLFTTFGAMKFFIIEKYGNKFTLEQYKDNWTRPFANNKLEYITEFFSAKQFQDELLDTLEGQKMYAEDAFGRGLIHKDNYIAFCNAFVLCNVVESADGVIYKPVKSNDF